MELSSEFVLRSPLDIDIVLLQQGGAQFNTEQTSVIPDCALIPNAIFTNLNVIYSQTPELQSYPSFLTLAEEKANVLATSKFGCSVIFGLLKWEKPIVQGFWNLLPRE